MATRGKVNKHDCLPEPVETLSPSGLGLKYTQHQVLLCALGGTKSSHSIPKRSCSFVQKQMPLPCLTCYCSGDSFCFTPGESYAQYDLQPQKAMRWCWSSWKLSLLMNDWALDRLRVSDGRPWEGACSFTWWRVSGRKRCVALLCLHAERGMSQSV